MEAGRPETLAQSMLATRVGAHIAVIGVLTGVDSKLPLGLALAVYIRLQALLVNRRRQQQDMVRALEAGDMRPVLDRHFALEDMADAFRYQESGQHFGKIILDI